MLNRLGKKRCFEEDTYEKVLKFVDYSFSCIFANLEESGYFFLSV